MGTALARTDTNWKSMVWLLAVLNYNLLADLLSLSFYPTVLVVTYVLKARIPDSCDSASELHLYIQMDGAVKNFCLERRKE